MQTKILKAIFSQHQTPFQLDWEQEKEKKKNQARRAKRCEKSRIVGAMKRRLGGY